MSLTPRFMSRLPSYESDDEDDDEKMANKLITSPWLLMTYYASNHALQQYRSTCLARGISMALGYGSSYIEDKFV